MAKYIYGGTLVAFETAKSSDVIDEFQKIETMSAAEEIRTNDAIKFPAGEGNDIRITENSAQRVGTVLSFGPSGEVVLALGLADSVASCTADAETATTEAGIATAQAGIATTQAGTATTKAGEASTSADEAAASAAELAGMDTLTYAATKAFDFNGSQTQLMSCTGDLTTLSTTNGGAGKSFTLILYASAAFNITYNASWKKIGALPTTIPIGKYVLLSFVATDTGAASVIVTGGLEL